MSTTNFKDIVKSEYGKCLDSPVYFAKNYCMIQHPTRGRIKFDLYAFQEKTLYQIQTHRHTIILKSRQLGISTLSAAYSLWLALFHNDKEILVVATKQDTAKKLVTKVRVMYENLPVWLRSQETTEENNKLSIRFKNGSQIVAASSASDVGRSAANSLVIIDEAAFIQGFDEKWASLQQTLSTGGDIIVLSCVTKDTYVFTDIGMKQVNDFIPNNGVLGDYDINLYNIRGNNSCRAGNLFHNNGKVKTKKIITKLNELEGSLNHKLWACKDGIYDWYELKDLNKNDWVNVSYGMNLWGNNDDVSEFNPDITSKHKQIFNPNEITKDISYLFGLYLSEGCATKIIKADKFVGGALTITCGDNITHCFNNLNLKYYTSDNMHYNVSSKTLIEFFEYVGFNLENKSHQKIIPSRLLEMSKENIVSMLSGLFDGDGSSSTKDGKISYVSTSKELVDQIRLLLLNLGIRSMCYKHDKDTTNSYNYFEYPFNHDSYQIELNYHNSYLFYEQVGFKLNRKHNNRELVIKHLNKISSNSRDVIPYGLAILKELFNIFDGNITDLRKKHSLNFSNQLNSKTRYHTEHICSKNVFELYELVKHKLSEDRSYELEKILIPNSEWVQIKEMWESENETYDFSLPENEDDFWSHSILYNGILGHQTPNGKGNFFHKTWVGAETGDNPFHPIKLHWTVHPDRTQKWRDEQDVLLGERMAGQECDCLCGDTIVTIKNKETGEIENISLCDLEDVL